MSHLRLRQHGRSRAMSVRRLIAMVAVAVGVLSFGLIGSAAAYIAQVRFQSGRAFTPQEAAILIALAEQL